MLFIDPSFIFIFLPLALAAYYALRRLGRTGGIALAVLVLFSLGFYAYWRVSYLAILIGSIAFNFAWARLMTAAKSRRRALLIVGVALNLGLLAVFKYAGFAADSVAALTGLSLQISIILPIGISFYTFQQIAYLADAYQSGFAYKKIVPYALFVSFFPQLIAGPIVHHREMMPQFLRRRKTTTGMVVIGVTQFTIGLAKKVVVADTLATFSTPYFDAAQADPTLGLPSHLAWMAALAFTLQLYFDFSGYSDMALGLARMFGIRLPINFNSPYHATSIIDFWRRWHITLSRFLRDYLYVPLGGNRRGPLRRYVNLMVTMLLGGLWHGAGWTFVLWGGLHGLFLVVNNLFRAAKQKLAPGLERLDRPWTPLAWGLTFLAVLNAWVLFRAESLASAGSVLGAMWSFTGPETIPGNLHVAPLLQLGGVRANYSMADYASFFPYFAVPLLLIVTRRRNSNGISISWAKRVVNGPIHSRLLWSLCILGGFYLSMVLVTYSRSEFLYFQF